MLSERTAKVLEFIKKKSNNGKEYFEMNLTDIGDEIGLSPHQVHREIRKLMTAGLVERIRTAMNTPAMYRYIGNGIEDLTGRGNVRISQEELATLPSSVRSVIETFQNLENQIVALTIENQQLKKRIESLSKGSTAQ